MRAQLDGLAPYQRLKVAKSTQLLASENWLAGVAAEPIKQIVTFGADNNTMGLECPSVVVTIDEPSPRKAPHHAVVRAPGDPTLICTGGLSPGPD
jgi:hypothetical protein